MPNTRRTEMPSSKQPPNSPAPLLQMPAPSNFAMVCQAVMRLWQKWKVYTSLQLPQGHMTDVEAEEETIGGSHDHVAPLTLRLLLSATFFSFFSTRCRSLVSMQPNLSQSARSCWTFYYYFPKRPLQTISFLYNRHISRTKRYILTRKFVASFPFTQLEASNAVSQLLWLAWLVNFAE